jgi:hypothetical protein
MRPPTEECDARAERDEALMKGAWGSAVGGSVTATQAFAAGSATAAAGSEKGTGSAVVG